MPWAMLLWPGLPQIWYRGQWIGLAKALGAAVLLNVVLLGTFGWSEQISSGTRNVLWLAVGGFWTASAVAGYVQTRRQVKRKQVAPAKDTYPQAMDYYLKGDYFQSECLLVDLLTRNERDLDARVMLATLYRHARRYEEATKQLDLLVRFEGSEKWQVEIERERTLIEEGIKDGKHREDASGGIIRMDNAPLAA
jgi:hypothetical protein